MIPSQTTNYLLAKEMGRSLKLLFDGLGLVHQVGCCSANDRGLFYLYVTFDRAPEPSIAIKMISIACLELNGLHFQVLDPLNYMAYVKLPFTMKEQDLDEGLRLIRQNIPALTARVSQGMDVHVEDF